MAVHADLNQRVTLNGQAVPLVQRARLLQAADANQIELGIFAHLMKSRMARAERSSSLTISMISVI
jgi:hypothetical protein